MEEGRGAKDLAHLASLLSYHWRGAFTLELVQGVQGDQGDYGLDGYQSAEELSKVEQESLKQAFHFIQLPRLLRNVFHVSSLQKKNWSCIQGYPLNFYKCTFAITVERGQYTRWVPLISASSLPGPI